MFDPKSRYADARLKTLTIELPDGRTIAYKEARTLPPPNLSPAPEEIASRPGERIDALAARALGDPELSWQFLDANEVLDPFAAATEWPRLWRMPPKGSAP